jgi:hypothetical protein
MVSWFVNKAFTISLFFIYRFGALSFRAWLLGTLFCILGAAGKQLFDKDL